MHHSQTAPAKSLPTISASGSFQMLQGVTVLDLTTSIAGPYATMLLADFGAEVIKVERPSGDDARHWGPPFLDGESLWFLSVNRNKKSVRIDTAQDAGRELLNALFETADVVVTNQLGSVQKKLGVDAETVRLAHPKLIHLSLTGFGLFGPNAGLPCYDLIAEGYSSVMDLTGEADADPQKVGTPAADLLAGSDAALAILAALHRRAMTGEGATLDVSLTESMIRFMSPRIVPYLGSGEVPRRSGGKDSVIAIYQTFETADLPLTLGLGNDAIWRRFWDAVGQPEKANSNDVATNTGRRANRAAIVKQIQDILKTGPRAQWLARFAAAKVPAGPIYRVDEVIGDSHFLERNLFYRVERDGHQLPQVGLGIHVDGEAAGCRIPPPRLGEHSEDVLRAKLGYGAAEIAELRARGII